VIERGLRPQLINYEITGSASQNTQMDTDIHKSLKHFTVCDGVACGYKRFALKGVCHA